MKIIPINLLNHYKTCNTTISQCWRAELTDGTVICSTLHDQDLLIEGEVYYSTQAYTGSDIENTAGLSPGNLEVTGLLISPAITSEDLESGKWDKAQIEVFEVNFNDISMGKNILHIGVLGELKAGRTKFICELQDLFYMYSKTIITLVSKECRHHLGDNKCGVNLASYTVTGTIGSVTANRLLNDAARTEPNDHFTKGVLTFTSGLNENLSMEVKQSWSSGQIGLWQPMPYTVVIGDTYSMHAGCLLRRDEDCGPKFGNTINFGGFPDLPGSKIYEVGGRNRIIV